MRLEAMAITMPEVADHPNRIPFEGVLTVVDEASTRPPSGARGHRVILTREAAGAALPSLLGMAVDYAPKWDGHDAPLPGNPGSSCVTVSVCRFPACMAVSAARLETNRAPRRCTALEPTEVGNERQSKDRVIRTPGGAGRPLIA